MRLLHVTTIPLSLYFLRGQAEFMRQHGITTSIVSSPGHLLDSFQASEEVHVYPVEMTRRFSPLLDLRALYQLLRCIQRLKPDVLHAHTPKAGLLAMIAGSVAKIPVRIYQIHGLPLSTATGLRKALLWTSEYLACRLSTRVLSVSESLREDVIKRALVRRNEIDVIGHGSANGVDSEGRFNPLNYTNEQVDMLRKLHNI